jgi:YidC/Oxa1 family membrane protein insertase
VSIIDVIGTPVAQVLKGIHTGITKLGVESGSGWAWGTSIVLLVVCVRLLLFPLFVKQIRSQRRMQELSPKIKELQKLHKGDRETLNQEMMKLYKDNNANPIAGCLPLILQLPVFFALFSVLREFKPGADARFGLSDELLKEGGRARIINAPISAALNSPADFIRELGGNPSGTRIVAVIMLVTMGLTTFITQRQMIARNTTTDPTQLRVQKVLLYVLPLSFSVFGFSFPVGVLLYWLTTNLWSMGQQHWVIKKMPPPNLGGANAGPKSTPAPLAGKGKPGRGKAKPGGAVDLVKDEAPAPVVPTAPVAKTSTGRPTPSGGRNAGSRKNKKRKGGRR